VFFFLASYTRVNPGFTAGKQIEGLKSSRNLRTPEYAHLHIVKASNFGPYVDFGLSFRKACYLQNAFYRKMQKNERCNKKL
jgi:hypothetical protein